jgi:hypothetical protein
MRVAERTDISLILARQCGGCSAYEQHQSGLSGTQDSLAAMSPPTVLVLDPEPSHGATQYGSVATAIYWSVS